MSKAQMSHGTVKPVLTTTFLKLPPVLIDHVVVLPQVFRPNLSLCSEHLYNTTNNHLNDVPGFLLPAYNDHRTVLFLEVIVNSQDIFVLKLFIAALQGGFIQSHTYDKQYVEKIFRLLKVATILILYKNFLRFSENQDTEFELGPTYFNFPCTGN